MRLSRRNLIAGAAFAPLALAAPALLGRATATAQTSPMSPAPRFSRRMIGAIEVTALYDGQISFPTQFLAGFEETSAASSARNAYRAHDPNTMVFGVSGYLIRAGGRVIAVDTGATAAMAPTVGGWHGSLAAAGVTAEEVDTVFATHLHGDHVGGLTDPATGTKLLPNARLVAGAVDWAFTHDDAVLAQLPPDMQGFFQLSRTLVAPYGADKELIEAGAEIAPRLTTVALPGHTPGHMGLRVDDGGESLLIWGDVLHATAYQFSNPDWALAFDTDPAAASATRRMTLDMAASDRLLVAGMHLDMPGFGYVETAGDVWRYVAAPPDYRVA
jgi:glyoxylase-like metal-dependent hydrolase (beta-lactamase superfamily II)